MHFPPVSESRSLLLAWACKENALFELMDVFGSNKPTCSNFLERIRSGDFSWFPEIQILPSSIMGSALGGYSRDLKVAFLSNDCPRHLLTSVLLEEIGHHIDALLHSDTGHETPGDEGALFSATVRGEILTTEDLHALFNENDFSEIEYEGVKTKIECSVRALICPLLYQLFRISWTFFC
jgi:hypothetical protein